MTDVGSTSRKWLLALVASLMATTTAAGLSGVRYELSGEPGKFWKVSPEALQLRDSLRELAEFGITDAQMLLADQLSMSRSFVHLREAALWYQKAYDGGRNDAPGSLARTVSKQPLLARKLLPYFRKVTLTLSPEKDFDSVWSLLEIQFSYPELADPEKSARLLALYNRACINTCFHRLFSARATELNGREAQALELYQQAAVSSGRGVTAYFDFLERYDDRESRFQAFANGLFDSAESLSTEVVQSIAGKLQNLSSEFNPTVLAWLDLALAKGATNAPINRIEYMLSLPDSFSFLETEQQITAIAQEFPIKSKLLRAQLLTTRTWKKLDPYTAYDLLKGLQDQGITEAHTGMGDLYSMGGLDEVDQFQAIEEYKKAARKGYAAAFYKIANIYRYGRSICNDKVQSHAHGRMALMLGEGKAEEFVGSLATELSAAEATQAESLYRTLLAAYPVEAFE